MKGIKMITTRIIGMQAESMLNSALTGNKNFARNATAFFHSAQEQPGNALLALYSEIHKKEGKSLTGWFFEQVRFKGGVRNKLQEMLMQKSKENYNLLKEINLFKKVLSKDFSKSLDKRLAIADIGTVKFDNRLILDDGGKVLENLHRKNFKEKLKLKINDSARNGFIASIIDDMKILNHILKGTK